MKKKSKDNATKEKEIATISKILESYFDHKNMFTFEEDTEVFLFPTGTISYDDSIWTISFDYAMVSGVFDVTRGAILVKLLWENNIKVWVIDGHFSIFNEEDVCVGCLFDSEIDKYVEENKVNYQEAKTILEVELKKKYREANPQPLKN